jgi:glutamine amidotransferase-like uncharacterized protein
MKPHKRLSPKKNSRRHLNQKNNPRKYLSLKKIVLIAIAVIFIFFIINTAISNAFGGSNSSNQDTSTVHVLIFNGTGVITGSVDGVEDCLDKANQENLIPNVVFNYSTTDEINSKTLSGYDVLVMPGGLATTYLEDSDIDSSAMKNFVSSGKGYVGICAGAYAATSYVDGCYEGWGIAPNIRSKVVSYQGELNITMTSTGSDLLNSSGVQDIYHWNGPAMYKNGSYTPIAYYTDNTTGYENYAAILDDTYGSGRVLLSGSHPELDPQKPEMLAKMILWASGKS